MKRAKAPAAPAPIAPLHSRQASRPSVPRSSNISSEARSAATASTAAARPNRMAMRSVPSSSSGPSSAPIIRSTIGGPRRVPLTDSHPAAMKQSQPAVPNITARRVPLSNPVPVVKPGAGISRAGSKMPGPPTHAPIHPKVTGIGNAPARMTGPANTVTNTNRPPSRIPSSANVASGIKPPTKYTTHTQTSGIHRPTSRLPAPASASGPGSKIRMPGTSAAATGAGAGARGIPVPTRRAF